MSEERRRYYYWITAKDPETGKPYLIFGHAQEEQARMRGFEMLPGIDFELVRLPTSNLQRASSLLKGNRLEKTHSLKEAGQRLGHEKTVRRQQKRRTYNVPQTDNIW